MGHPPEEVLAEVAYIAYHFHWSREEAMALPHAERREWVAEISALNDRVNSGEKGVSAWP